MCCSIFFLVQGFQQEGEQGGEGEARVWGHDSAGQAHSLGAWADHTQAHQGSPASGTHRWAQGQANSLGAWTDHTQAHKGSPASIRVRTHSSSDKLEYINNSSL